MKRAFRLMCFLLAMAISGLMGLGWTEAGLKVLVAGAQFVSDGIVRCGSVQGTLFSAFQLEGVVVQTSDVELKFGRIASSWRSVELFDGRLHIADLSFHKVEVRLLTPEVATEPTEEHVILPQIALPIGLLFDRITVDGLTLLDSDFSELTRIDRLSFSLSGDNSSLVLNGLILRAPGYDGDLAGKLDTEKDWYVELAGEVEYRDYGVGPFRGDVQVKGPLARLDAVVDLRQPARGHIEGQILELPNNFKWTADLHLSDVQLADGHDILPELLFSVTGKAQGEMLEYGGTLKGKLDYLFFHDVETVIEVHGNEDQIEFPKISVANGHGKAELTDGLLSWKDDLIWHGHLVTEGVDPAMIWAEYPGAIDADVYSSGQYGEQSGLQLFADFKSVAGELRGYALKGQGRLKVDSQSARIEHLLLQSGKATLTFDGLAESATTLANWRKSLSWKGDLELQNFDPGLLFSDYPGSLNGVIVSEGTVVTGEMAGTAAIKTLNGEVRGYPVEGRGSVGVAEHQLHIDDLLLKSGRSVLRMNGQAGDQFEVSADFSSNDLGELLADAHGELQLTATLDGERTSPHFAVKGEARRLAWEDMRLNGLQADLSGGLTSEAPWVVKLRGSGLGIGTFAAESAELTLDGALDHHRFSAKIGLGEGNVSLAGDGSLAGESSWTGRVRDVRISHTVTGDWQQGGHTDIKASTAEVQVSPLCLMAGQEKICGEGSWSVGENSWTGKLDGRDLDLARLNGLLNLSDPLRGKGRVSFSASGNLTAVRSAMGEVEIVHAGIGEGDKNSELTDLELRRATMQAVLEEGNLKTDLAVDFANGSFLRSEAKVSGFGPLGASPLGLPLQGSVEMDVKDLAFVAPLTQYYVRPTGRLEGSLQLAGTVGKPEAEGRLKLVDGQLEMVTLGIAMSDVSCTLNGTEGGIDLLAKASSGPGQVQAAGRLQLTDGGVYGDLTITGENFDTTSLPEYVLRTSPDLRFVFDRNGGSLTGRVEVPHGVIAPERMTDYVSVSDDVVYVNGDEEENGGGWPFSTSLQIQFGDDVRLDGYGITGYLRGELQVTKVPGSAMRGQGQLYLADGKFSVYGRTLTIERSRLMFAGGPVDNPGVDVRAKKIVADNKRPGETIEVGVDVSGTADNLDFTLFSNPAMEESDILAYMVVGRAMSDVGQQDESLISSAAMALGMDKQLGAFGELSELLPVDEVYIEGDRGDEMSLVVGKHLTRELFIGYGHNFFNQEGEVRLRYNLGAGFAIETRSSGERTGTDLIYSFER